MDSSVEKSVIRSVLSKSLSRDIETLVRKWGCFSESDIQKLNFRATKSAIASQIFELCKELGLKQEIGDLDLLCTQLHSSSKKWTVLKLKGGQLKTDLDPQDLRDRLVAVLETDCLGDVHLNVKSYGGAIWIRVYVQGAAPFKTTDVVYVLSYPHTPILIACRMKVKMQEIVYSALVEVFESEEVTELQLTGHHLPSLADLALQQTSQGPFWKYRNIEEAVNPLIRSKVSTKSVTSEDKERETDERLMDENREEKQSRQERLDSTFGTHAQPTLEKLEYKLDLRFRGTTFAPGMKGQPDLFHCRVKFEGPSVLEGTKNLGRTGFASLPLPRHLAKVHSLAKNHFTVAEMDSARKRPSSQSK
ncbi:centromere protein N-like isoform X1 [Littorina saxatilis]|uniref:Centromere protein N n=1 Tax=Littorina saxatilis TaxID=31220 RepID=A0AAN9C0N0_9CAEN